MISVGFKRVSKKRPCRICGKPTYCGFSRDEGTGVVGVPGFWQELSSVVHIWKPRNYVMPLLVIPYKDANGLIQACQIRLHANDNSSDEKRYYWLSSPLERHGTSSRTPIHFTFVEQQLPPGATVSFVSYRFGVHHLVLGFPLPLLFAFAFSG
jgi:hypothetical protein